jgi:uncharacterized protein (DUF58 family)
MSTAAANARSRFLDLRALAALENMQFVTRQSIEGSYSGRHRSPRHGGSGEFADYREYSDGEDLRRLDWKVLARTGRAYTRLYHDETNLRALLVVDRSASMSLGGDSRRSASSGFMVQGSGLGTDGSGFTVQGSKGAGSSGAGSSAALSKLEYAQYLATALSHVITRRQDQVGLAVVSDRVDQRLPFGAASRHAAAVQEAIERIEPKPVGQLNGALRNLFEQAGRRGVLLVLSDFLFEDLEAAFADLRLFRHRNWEVVLLHLVHPDEERLPEGIGFRFVGLEGEGTVDASPGEIRAEYERRFANHLEMVRSLAGGAGCDYRRVSTAVPYLQTLRGFLTERAG